MTKVRRFHVREFFDSDRRDWPCGDRELFEVEFEDGVILTTNTPRMEVSRKLWRAHEYYRDLPIKSYHHIGDGPLPPSKVEAVLGDITRDIHYMYMHRPGYNREHVWKLSYEALNRLYNEAIVEYSEYVRSISTIDFHEVYMHPPIKAVRDALRPNEGSIEKAGKKTVEVIRNDTSIRHNPIVSIVRAELPKTEQLTQIITVRGPNTDIDSTIYPVPIMGNYYAGITDPAEVAMESTLAAKAILAQGQPLEQTEYANRKIQFTAAAVDLLVMGDCGSTVYGEFELTPERFKDMEGINYVDPKSGKLKPLRSDDKPLVGQVLKFRLPFFCGYRHHNCVCSTCYGDLAYNIPYGTNIGHLASTMTQSEVSQRVLKIKHSESATVSESIRIADAEKEFIKQSDDNRYILLKPELKAKKCTMAVYSTVRDKAINASTLIGMDIRKIKSDMSVAKYSQFKTVSFDVPRADKKPVRYRVSVSRGARMSYFTHEFLWYFLKLKLKPGNDGLIHIPLDGWDFSKPVFELPNRHMNMRDFASEVEVFIRSTQDDSEKHLGRLRQLIQYDDPVEALLDLHELISSKVSAHFTHISVVILSMMVSGDLEEVDYRIPPLGAPFRFEKYNEIIYGRSIGASFPYQGGAEQLLKFEQYTNTDRDVHLLDPILLPE